jgi:hypothetical protein
MDERHERSLIERWPEWFDVNGDARRTLMRFGSQHGNGWYGLFYGLCEQLEPLVAELNGRIRPRGEHFEVLEVKQKMGELRFYVSHHTDSIDSRIEAARMHSREVCENCSRTGRMRDHPGWLQTLCDDCQAEYEIRTLNSQQPRAVTAPRFPAVYLLHGKGGSAEGSAAQLEAVLRQSFPDLAYVRPTLPHGRDMGKQSPMCSFEFLRDLRLPEGSLVIGVSLGGLIAAKLQEEGRQDLHVICISSPTWVDGLAIELRAPRRIALYSSRDEVIAGRTSLWPHLAEAYDLRWLTHDTDVHKDKLGRMIVAYMNGCDIAAEVERV